MDRIETERLTLRAFEPTDVEDVYKEIYSTSDVWGPRPRQFAEDSVAMAVLMAQSYDDLPWAKRAVILNETGEFSCLTTTASLPF